MFIVYHHFITVQVSEYLESPAVSDFTNLPPPPRQSLLFWDAQ